MAWQCPDPATMHEAVAAMHEYFLELRKTGFTHHEALHIITGNPCCQRDDR